MAVGDRLDVEGPFGTFTLRESRTSALVFVGGGAGMAPVLGLLRSMAERGVERQAVFYYGARQQRDLCFEEELRELEEQTPRLPVRPGALRARRTATMGRRGRD